MPTGIKVREVMIKEVVTSTPDQSAQQGAQLMSEKDVGLLIICENSKPVGIVTREDIITKIVQHNKDLSSLTLRDIMNIPVVSCSPDDDLATIAQLMLKYGFKRMPVVDQGNLIGLISYREIIKVTPEEVSTLREQLLKDEPVFYPKKRGPGNCEVCENYADDLSNKNGKWVCTNCIETTAEID